MLNQSAAAVIGILHGFKLGQQPAEEGVRHKAVKEPGVAGVAGTATDGCPRGSGMVGTPAVAALASAPPPCSPVSATASVASATSSSCPHPQGASVGDSAWALSQSGELGLAVQRGRESVSERAPARTAPRCESRRENPTSRQTESCDRHWLSESPVAPGRRPAHREECIEQPEVVS